MKQLDKYKYYKEKYDDVLVLIREGSFYKCYCDDAKIIWYLFNYVYVDDIVSFGSKAYSKVFDELNRLKISYVIITEEENLIKFDNDIYNIYLNLATTSYEFNNKIKVINDKVEDLLNVDKTNYDKIIKFLNEL